MIGHERYFYLNKYGGIGIGIIITGFIISYYGIQFFFNLEKEESEIIIKPTLLEDEFEESFFERGWLDDVSIEYETKAPAFMVNEDIIFHIMVSVKQPVERVRVNIFYEEDRNLFEDPPTENLNYPDKNLPGFDKKGRILGIDLEPNSESCEICGYSVWTEPRYFEQPGKYSIHIGALQNGIPVNWTSTRSIFDLKSEEEVFQMQLNQNTSTKIENMQNRLEQNEFETKGYSLFGIGIAVIGIGITLFLTGQSKESIEKIQKQDNEYYSLQNQKTDLQFKLSGINRQLEQLSNDVNPDLAEIESQLNKDADKIQKNIDEIDNKMDKLRKDG